MAYVRACACSAGARRTGECSASSAFTFEMEAERIMREEGLAPAEARRRAAVAFGGVEKYQEELRSERGFAWLKGTVLDLKLGLRLLFKNPGFTLVSGLGIMVATAFMAGIFSFMYSSVYLKLPLPEGDRIVALENWDTRANNEERRSLHDFIALAQPNEIGGRNQRVPRIPGVAVHRRHGLAAGAQSRR